MAKDARGKVLEEFVGKLQLWGLCDFPTTAGTVLKVKAGVPWMGHVACLGG